MLRLLCQSSSLETTGRRVVRVCLGRARSLAVWTPPRSSGSIIPIALQSELFEFAVHLHPVPGGEDEAASAVFAVEF